MLNTICKFTAIALVVVLGLAALTGNAVQGGTVYQETEARTEREIQACMRPAILEFQNAVNEAQQNLKKARVEAEQDFNRAMRNNKSDAARTAAKQAKQEALRKAQQEATKARRAAQHDKQKAEQSCRNPKQPETSNNNSGNNNPNKAADSSDRSCVALNSTEKTLGRGPRGQNSVRMDLRVVDETGRPLEGVKMKLWSERQSNGMLCETIHTTNACGTVLMDPIHFNKTLQLKLEAKGYKPQVMQVEPAQLNRPFRAVMQAK